VNIGHKEMNMKGFFGGVLLFLGIQQLCFATYYGQFGQDRSANEKYFKDMSNGTFVEIGAADGIALSNTYFFESELSWNGMCVEPNPDSFVKLKHNRKCLCVEGCVSDTPGEAKFLHLSQVALLGGLVDKYDPRHLERVQQELQQCGGSSKEITVQCYTFNDLMKNHGMSHVNFLSVDTEGGEYEILASIDFSKYMIDVITVEDNYGDPRFLPLLASKGFALAERKGCDLMFVRCDFQSTE
jgi:FkbM family methyltransferase